MRTPPNPVVRPLLAVLAGCVGVVVGGLGLCWSPAHAAGEEQHSAAHEPTGQAGHTGQRSDLTAEDEGVVDQEVVVGLVGLGAGMATIGGVIGTIRVNLGHRPRPGR